MLRVLQTGDDVIRALELVFIHMQPKGMMPGRLFPHDLLKLAFEIRASRLPQPGQLLQGFAISANGLKANDAINQAPETLRRFAVSSDQRGEGQTEFALNLIRRYPTAKILIQALKQLLSRRIKITQL